MPGSPQRCDASAIIAQSSFARTVLYVRPLNVKGNPASVASAVMKASVMPTDRLKFVRSSPLVLAAIKSMISGWSMFKIPIDAPRRTPPCITMSDDALYNLIKETTPDACPLVDLTMSPRGLMVLKL
ncbi:MAG: hypothetical protein DDT32_02346 [Syntrophomonadaceae bacterium]|nr:hypothetical protein [Bacillota bacterium]